MALAKGKSSVLSGPLTLHTDTAIHVAHQLTKVSDTVEPRHNEVLGSSGKFVILGRVGACGGYTKNLNLVRYIASFVMPVFVLTRFDCA